jgi:phosphopantothenoylcysteine decarboxylase/phosphopantothenate--cysteine ligase
MWDAVERFDPRHVSLTDRADLMIVAPATANIIGKIASGIADELVSTLAITAMATCPILLAPAMNERMWQNPIVQANFEKLTGLGMAAVGPNEGWLACRAVGKGRMAEPEEIFDAAKAILLKKRPKAAG